MDATVISYRSQFLKARGWRRGLWLNKVLSQAEFDVSLSTIIERHGQVSFLRRCVAFEADSSLHGVRRRTTELSLI
jgi:hypothetical protein